MVKYYAFIVDLVQSRRMNDKERFDAQKKLNMAVEIVNRVFESEIEKSLSFSAGDSVQCLFSEASSAYKTFYFLENALFPHSIRCGIGYGEVNQRMISEFKSNDSNIYDGDAYHLAKQAIDRSKKYERKIVLLFDDGFDNVVNELIDDSILVSMTTHRKAIYSLINMIDPVIGINKADIDFYYEKAKHIIMELTDYYRKRSKANKGQISKRLVSGKLNVDTGSIMDIDMETIDRIFHAYKADLFGSRYDDRMLDTILAGGDSTITSSLREVLVELVQTSYQNVNYLIRASKMDELRKKHISKQKLIRHYYGKE